jgi:superfamily II DNA or RNA helicase
MITLFDFQKENINQIWKAFKTHDKICYQLSTGGGKTIIFSALAKLWNDKFNKRVLILCHRIELVDQTIATLNKMGVTCEAVTSKVKKLNHYSQCYVAMIETANNRLKKDPFFFKEVGLLIADECHILVFDKVFEYFKDAKILGCTATPVVMKRVYFYKCKYCKTKHDEQVECCDEIIDEWSKPFTLSSIYDDIICGPNIDDLIKMERLVKEISFVESYIDSDKLKTDADGEFTAESMDTQYGSDDAVFNVLLNYEKLCLGKKTLIFNNSAKINALLFIKFKEAGHNVRMYDSINESEYTRHEIVDWFKSNHDAVLLNVAVFTTGLDVQDIQAIIINRAIGSLSLFIQIAGRGGRVTDLIYKDSFILVDGGGNIDRHQEWSDPTRDWKRIFFGLEAKEKMKKEDAFDIDSCENCGALYPKSEPCCPECGHEIIPKPKPLKSLSENILLPIRKIPPPNAEKIYKYTISRNENINFAFKILISQIVDLFKFYRVPKQQYESNKLDGRLLKRIKTLIQKCYFTLISKPDIKADNNRTINSLVERTIIKLDKFYFL